MLPVMKAARAFVGTIAIVSLAFLAGCGVNQLEKEEAVKACREYVDIWNVRGRYVVYNSIGDWFVCYSQSGDALRQFNGDYIRERMGD